MSSSDSGSTPLPPIKKQRDHEPADFDNVQDEISHEEIQNTPEEGRARKIVAWANWWFRPGKFWPLDDALYDAWDNATANAVAMPETRAKSGERPQMSPDEQRVIQHVQQSLVPVITRPFEDMGYMYALYVRTEAHDFVNGYSHYRERWIGSEQCENLERILEASNMPLVNKIVAFGTGSPLFTKNAINLDLTDANGFVTREQIELHRFRFRQYAILLWMAEYFQRKQKGHRGYEDVQVYVQEPDLKETDEHAMESLGFKILDGEYDCQEGFTKIDHHTFVYDAVISSSICQIYMEYAYPAAVMTMHLDFMEPCADLQDHHKYVILQDGSKQIADGEQFLWPRPLRPAVATKTAFNFLRTYYTEVPLIDWGKLEPERWYDGVTFSGFYHALYQQLEQEKADYYRKINQEIEAMKEDALAKGSFNQQGHQAWARQMTQWKEKNEPPRTIYDLNWSGQPQLALYVRNYA